MGNSRNYLIQFIFDEKIQYEKFPQVTQPGHQYVHGEDTIQFAPRNTDTIIFIPNAKDLFVDIDDDYIVIPLAVNDPPQTFTIKHAENKRIFPYAVYCKRGNGFAEGGTSPAIIVEG